MSKKRPIDFSNLSELGIFETEVTKEDKDTGEVKTYKTVDRAEIAAKAAFLIGIDDAVLDAWYGGYYANDLARLRENREACILRYLNRIRTALMQNYLNVDNKIRYELSNLDRMEYFNREEIAQLEKWGIGVLLTNSGAERYSVHLCGLIEENAEACRSLFPEYVNYDYIKDLFIVPKYQKISVLKAEYNRFRANKQLYPFQAYIHWKPEDRGNILSSDRKFLETIYSQHGETFYDRSKVHDAVEDTKKSIYDYIDGSERVVMVVDCENSDAYKLYSILKHLNQEEISAIEKIILYDDYHTTTAWDYLAHMINIPVEHIEVERIMDAKSLVDIRMTAGVCRAYYEEHVDSFILCSSDSDFWGLISSMPQARFLVMYEYSKCGNAIREALSAHRVYHCSMDDFYSGSAGDLRKVVLKKMLEKYLPELLGENAWELTRRIYGEAYISASENEMKAFYEKYVKNLKLKIGPDGCFFIDIPM